MTFLQLRRLAARGNGAVLSQPNRQNRPRDLRELRLQPVAGVDHERGRRRESECAEGVASSSSRPTGCPDRLVVIANVSRARNGQPVDTAFWVALRSVSYQPGVHTLQITKSYVMPAGPFNRKPTTVRVPAYELTYSVSCQQQQRRDAVRAVRTHVMVVLVTGPFQNSVWMRRAVDARSRRGSAPQVDDVAGLVVEQRPARRVESTETAAVGLVHLVGVVDVAIVPLGASVAVSEVHRRHASRAVLLERFVDPPERQVVEEVSEIGGDAAAGARQVAADELPVLEVQQSQWVGNSASIREVPHHHQVGAVLLHALAGEPDGE